MQFGTIPVSSALGAILVHSLSAGRQRFRKGRILSDADVAALETSGYREVTVARLEAGDIAEDAAAARIGHALSGEGIRIGAAFTGRANLFSDATGLALVDAERIAALNAIDEAITVATLSPFALVRPRQMIATVKVIPFAAPARAVEEAERLLSGEKAIAVAPFARKDIALVSTTLPETAVSILAKNRTAIDQRLSPFGSPVVHESRVPHRADELARAIVEARKRGTDLILVFGASAITDRRDVVPAAIAAAGGSIEHFGMPVDPGNLLLLGKLDGAIVVGLPGCARSPKFNGFDFVLQRLLANVPMGSKEIAAMGVGGLLAEIHTRPQPRNRRREFDGPHAPRIAAIVLAAGLSSRMGHNKLAEEVDGKPLICGAVESALASAASPVIVVTGNDPGAIEGAVRGLPVSFVRNRDFARGLSGSLICGIEAVPEDCDGVVVLLGDMPDVAAGTIDKLIAAFDVEEGRAICIATHKGRRGNPVLWSRQFFPDIRKLQGDVGAKALIGENEDLVCEVEAGNDGPLLDIDTMEALAAYRARTR